MTRDHARKKAIRARMAASGEPYSTAARRLDAADPAAHPEVTAEAVAARARSTLAAPRARIALRVDHKFPPSPTPRKRRVPPPVTRLASFVANAAWNRISPETSLADLRDGLVRSFRHVAGEGFVEPTADRYQIDFGGYAEMHFDGQYYGGASGRPLRANHHQEPPENPLEEPLALLRKLRDVTDVRPAGHETVRGTRCRVVAVRADSAEFTIWIDDEHVRRVRSVWNLAGELATGSVTRTLELWDFGAPGSPADWTHLPAFQAPRHSREPGR